MSIILKFSIIFTLISFVTSCASVDFDYPKSESTAMQDTQDTYFARLLSAQAVDHPAEESGFIVLADGIDALAARLVLAEKAEKSIDAQYYLIKSDLVGHAFLNVLLKAADRGVRVRLLVDDMFMGGYDAGLSALDSHPYIEIRIFNPFANRSARFIDGIFSFSRINRRMHNKSFTVDNQVTIIGGRNIAAEYFGAREDSKFSDLDVLGIGPVVQDVSSTFDTYWNHEKAAPLPAFAKNQDNPVTDLERIYAELETEMEAVLSSEYASAVNNNILRYFDTDNHEFIWAPYRLVVDSPDKAFKSKAEEVESITTPLRESILSAAKELMIISPYFVPNKSTIEAISNIQSQGVNVTIITNSLAANNQIAVHGGYAPSRKPLLKSGVKIYEFRDSANVSGSEIVALSSAKATLHAKAFVIDRKEIFIGSFNFDPRSAYINTELGVIIKSPELSDEFADILELVLHQSTYEVVLNEKGKLRWIDEHTGEKIIYNKEPDTSWILRGVAGFMRILPIRSQL